MDAPLVVAVIAESRSFLTRIGFWYVFFITCPFALPAGLRNGPGQIVTLEPEPLAVTADSLSFLVRVGFS